MNGYTSAIAAILSQGVKTTQPCNAPIAALALSPDATRVAWADEDGAAGVTEIA